jgi:hypothetical protein
MKIIRHYPYRTGSVHGISFPRETMRDLEVELNQLAGKQIDNHVCFSIVDERGNLCAVMFHDLVCIVGKEVEERRW